MHLRDAALVAPKQVPLPQKKGEYASAPHRKFVNTKQLYELQNQ